MTISNPVAVSADSPTPALSLQKTQFGPGLSGSYLDFPNKYSLFVQHTAPVGATAEKHYVQLSQQVLATDPVTGVAKYVTGSASFTLSFPSIGFTQAQKLALAKALYTDLMGGSDITVANMLLFES